MRLATLGIIARRRPVSEPPEPDPPPGPTGYTHFRLNITANNGDNNFTANREWTLYEESPGVTNVAPEGTASISDENATYNAANLNDGDTDTFAVSENGGAYPVLWTIVFPTARVIAEYGLDQPGGSALNRFPAAWTLEGSNDGTTWTTLDTRTSQSTFFGAGEQTYEVTT